MSQYKKAHQQLMNEKEFYAHAFLVHSDYLEWQKTVKPAVANEFFALLQTEHCDEERVCGILKKQPRLVNAILHSSILKQIKPWCIPVGLQDAN